MENLRNSREIELRQANQRLDRSVGGIARAAEAILQVQGIQDLTEYIRLAVEHHAGEGIRGLVQEHLTAYLVGPTSVRGRRLYMGIPHGFELDIDGGNLYEVRDPWGPHSTDPLPDQEWFRNWRGILGQVTCLKYY